MTLTFWLALLFSAPITAWLISPGTPLPGFGTLPGDLHFAGDGFAVILPFASSSLVLVGLYGMFKLGGEVYRLAILPRV